MKNWIRRIFRKEHARKSARIMSSSFTDSQEPLVVDESFERHSDILDGENFVEHTSPTAINHLPTGLIQHISSFLDDWGLLCLKNTSRYLRKTIQIDHVQFSRCVRWGMLVLLEEDLLSRGEPLPDRLACMYCKQAHPREEFGVRNGNAGYGIERLYILDIYPPEARHCWRYLPKLLDYRPDVAAPQEEKNNLEHLDDVWLPVYHLLCGHCLERYDGENTVCRKCSQRPLQKSEPIPEGLSAGSSGDDFQNGLCSDSCSACSWATVLHFERHGPRRSLDSYAHLRFVRMRGDGYGLAIRDLNGLRDPRKPLPKEPKVWRERCFFSEFLQQARAFGCLSSELYFDLGDSFSVYSPVAKIPEGGRFPGLQGRG